MKRNPVAAFFLICFILGFPLPGFTQGSATIRDLLAEEPKSQILRLSLIDNLALEGDYSGALAIARQLLLELPDNTLVRAKIGYFNLYLGRYEEAKETFQELLSRQNQSLDARYGLIRVFSVLLDWDRVKSVCQDVLSLDQGNFSAILNTAWAEFNLKNYPGAFDWYNTREHKNRRTMRLGQGWCLMRMKRFTEARSTFQLLCQEFPYDTECLNAFKEADMMTLRKEITKAPWGVMLTSDDIHRYLELAKKSRLSGKLKDALDLMNAILEHDPRNIPALAETARIHQEMGNFIQADFFYSVLLNRREDREALVGKITALRGLGRIGEAARFARRLLELAPNANLGHLTLGDYHYQIGEFQKALDSYVQAQSSETLILQGKGWSMLNLKQFDHAQNVFEEILKTQPQNANALEGLREIAEQKNRTAASGTPILEKPDAQ
jgi:tetratricopeptide (TPR) repeat protein